jgi:hypothetical protein
LSASSESLALADEEVEEGDWLLASSWPSTTAGSEPAEDDDDSAEEGADRESWQGRANWGDGEWEELAERPRLNQPKMECWHIKCKPTVGPNATVGPEAGGRDPLGFHQLGGGQVAVAAASSLTLFHWLLLLNRSFCHVHNLVDGWEVGEQGRVEQSERACCALIELIVPNCAHLSGNCWWAAERRTMVDCC